MINLSFIEPFHKDQKNKAASLVQMKCSSVIPVRKPSLDVALTYRMQLLDLSLKVVLMRMGKSMRIAHSLSMAVVLMVSPEQRVSTSKAVTMQLPAKMPSGAAVMTS